MGKINQLPTKVLILALRFYQIWVSPLLGNRCRFYPSCSCYAQQALTYYGIVRGLSYVLWRLLRCHPLHPGGYDPIPNEKNHHGL